MHTPKPLCKKVQFRLFISRLVHIRAHRAQCKQSSKEFVRQSNLRNKNLESQLKIEEKK